MTDHLKARYHCGAVCITLPATAAGRWLISAGLVDGPTGKHVVKNLWEQSKPDWYHLPPAAA